MNKLLPLFFILSSFAAVSQNNEINIAYQFHRFDNLKNHASVSYFRSISQIQDFGIRASFQWEEQEASSFYNNHYNVSLDLINRWNFTKGNRFRYWIELGLSSMKRFEYQYTTEYCYCIAPIDDAWPYNEEWVKTNHFGFTSGLGLDFNFFKRFHFGLSKQFKVYFENQDRLKKSTLFLSNLNLLLGYKF